MKISFIVACVALFVSGLALSGFQYKVGFRRDQKDENGDNEGEKKTYQLAQTIMEFLLQILIAVFAFALTLQWSNYNERKIEFEKCLDVYKSVSSYMYVRMYNAMAYYDVQDTETWHDIVFSNEYDIDEIKTLLRDGDAIRYMDGAGYSQLREELDSAENYQKMMIKYDEYSWGEVDEATKKYYEDRSYYNCVMRDTALYKAREVLNILNDNMKMNGYSKTEDKEIQEKVANIINQKAIIRRDTMDDGTIVFVFWPLLTGDTFEEVLSYRYYEDMKAVRENPDKFSNFTFNN